MPGRCLGACGCGIDTTGPIADVGLAGIMDPAPWIADRQRMADRLVNEFKLSGPQLGQTAFYMAFSRPPTAEEGRKKSRGKLSDKEREETIARLEKEMKEASKMLEFEYAAVLRDQIIELRGQK